MNRIDTLAHFDTDADWDAFKARIKQEGSIPTILYRVAIGSHTEVTYSWKVTYPANHENASLVRTWTTKIKKNANLKTIATLKGLYLFNAGAGEEPNRKEEDDFKEKNLLKNFNKDVFDYNVTGTGTDGTRLYFEATVPGSTFKVTYKGDTFPGVAGGATLTYFDVPAPGGPVEIIVTATNGETRKKYTVNIVPKEEVKPLSPLSLGIYVNGEGKLLATSPSTPPDTLLYLSQYDSTVVNEKGIPYFAEIKGQDTVITQLATGNVALYYMHSLKGGDGDTLAFRDKERNLLHIKWSGDATAITKPTGPAEGQEPDLIFKTFALTNGVDTFPITNFNPILKSVNPARYEVSVPDKTDATLKPVYTFYEGKEAEFKSKKYAFAKKTTIKSAGDVELVLTLRKPLKGEESTDKNIDNDTYWGNVIVKSDSLIERKTEPKNVDSAYQVPVQYVLTLKDNKAGFKFLKLFYDSITGTPVELNKPISDTVDLYKAVGYVPDKIKKVFAVVGSHGEVTLKGDFGTPKTSEYSVNKDYKVYEYEAKSWDSWDAGVSRDLIIEDKAEAGNSKQVTITLQKAYDLKLKSLSITQSCKTLFSRTANALKDSTDFDVLLDSDFEIGSLLDIQIDKTLATESKVVGFKRSLRLEGDVFAFTFTVVDPDGNTRDYHVNLSYPTSNANLDYLTTSVGLVSPSFSPDIAAYELVVADSVRSLRVLAGAQDPNAVVKLETASSRNVGVTFDLVYKTTVVDIQVVASNTNFTRDYTLTIVNQSLPTGIKAVTLDQVTIAAKSGALSITSPVAERVYIYSVTGNVISSVDKTAGSVVVPVSAKGVTVIKGTSGWVSKVYLK
ncbi:MAG: cadherin-like beta sandwich domain-containing protein [Dysgonamonadaceae bacterium]|nr:cadherin-like beta sandwich domain-containing protein [Dysgonamonadaceae bacterium]